MSGRVPDGDNRKRLRCPFRRSFPRTNGATSTSVFSSFSGYCTVSDRHSRPVESTERQGKFPGMSASHTFRIVVVGEDHGVGVEPFATPEKILEYSGAALAAKF